MRPRKLRHDARTQSKSKLTSGNAHERERTPHTGSTLRTSAPQDSQHLAQRARYALSSGNSWNEAVSAGAPHAVSVHGVLGASSELKRALSGVGPVVEKLLAEEAVTDVLINSSHAIWVDRGAGLEKVGHHRGSFADDSEVRRLAVRMAAVAGQRLDDQQPIVDGTLPGGIRLHAVLAPLGSEGTLISLRRHRPHSFTLEQMAELGTFPPQLVPLLDAAVAQHANMMISGSTGSGKTTLLAALLSRVSERERILVIEESAELQPQHPHVVHLQVRKANVQGAGLIDMSDLVKAAMRMRPDRLVLGECRGGEVRDVLSALNTGHEGGWATIHANSAEDVPARLVALGALAGMNEQVVAAQAASGLDGVLHIERTPHGRKLMGIAVFAREGSVLVAQPALTRVNEGWQAGPAWERLRARLKLSDATVGAIPRFVPYEAEQATYARQASARSPCDHAAGDQALIDPHAESIASADVSLENSRLSRRARHRASKE